MLRRSFLAGAAAGLLAFAGLANGIDLTRNYSLTRSLDLPNKIWSAFPDGCMFDRVALAWMNRQSQLVRPKPKAPRRSKRHYVSNDTGGDSRD